MNKYIDAFVDFVKSNDNWKELLKKKPYSLKLIKECSFHPNWFMFVYNLFDSELTKDVIRGCRGKCPGNKRKGCKNYIRSLY